MDKSDYYDAAYVALSIYITINKITRYELRLMKLKCACVIHFHIPRLCDDTVEYICRDNENMRSMTGVLFFNKNYKQPEVSPCFVPFSCSGCEELCVF